MITSDKSKIASSSLWQHPYVDVFKHFKLLPTADWKQNKKQGDVHEVFAKEIGRNAVSIQGSISANNYLQMPHPSSMGAGLGLTGRYIQIQMKSPNAGLPFSFHFDFGVAERAHNVRVSVSNLFKAFNISNGFVVQVPLELQSDKWTVVVLDIQELFKKSNIFPPTYQIEGCHSLKSITLCANAQVRGVYTSNNQYDYVSHPSDLRFKFSFDINKWPETFQWQNLPQDWESETGNWAHGKKGEKSKNKEEERKKMQTEIDNLLQRNKKVETEEEESDQLSSVKKSRIGVLPQIMGLSSPTEDKPVQGFITSDERHSKRQQIMNIPGLNKDRNDYLSGQYIGADLKRSPKLNHDPILELKHIIGYSPAKCLNLKWSKYQNESVVIFTSGGTLIAMDVENNNQKRFFFGHSAPICCFDINANGALIASAQEGKNSIIRIWEYSSGRCISMVTMPVNTLKCLAFSYDGKYLASSGKDSHNREIVIVWDITRISKGEKPEIVAKQTSDFNILSLRFSPIDSSRMASCGKENIRFWRIRENGSIRGSAVVLNHHARNTIFTSLDFEYGLKSNDPKENESQMRLYVGSKHGMVFQINCHTESLEASYQTNDSAIYSIAVNEAFCVTGSEDTYLRVWPLDFSEFFMEAKHEGTVCAVDISPDGLKVVCGTLYGSLGILDKSNQKYRTLLRSHTDQILNMDFHIAKRNIITVSKDKTIRLWDVDTFDQVYEFSSPVDQPLTVAAHPQLPLFSCGFESGVMRVFDIEKTCVADEFSQFNKPLQKLAYSPHGDLLVTCCLDGGVAIHNPRRQHLPIKMMHLEFPPEFVHVAFTTAQGASISNEQNENSDPNETAQRESLFAVMGEYGNNVNIYETNSFFVKHQIQANHILRAFQFANNNRDIVLVTSDCKVRVYSLAKYEGIFLREITTVHRGNVLSLSIANNSGYMLTGGEDAMVKVWDYEAQKTAPYYFQSFIGHTSPVAALAFNPVDNQMVLSAGQKDGIYLWSFYGDTKTNFVHQGSDEMVKPQKVQPQQQTSVLERMRNTRKEIKQQTLGEDTFILPAFKPLQQIESIPEESKQQDAYQYPESVIKARQERELSYNHYANCSQKFEVELEPAQLLDESQQERIIDAQIVNGYDGFGGVHDNLVWNSQAGWSAYTLHNKVIFENTKTREQTVRADSTIQLSTLALSADKKLLAAGEGSTNKFGNSIIFLYDTQTKKLVSKLSFHQRGVQSIAFSNNSKHLVSVGAQGDDTMAVWDIQTGVVLKSALIRHHAVNQIKVDPYSEEGLLQFWTVGHLGAFTIWRIDDEMQFQTCEIPAPYEYKKTDFTSISFTPFQPYPYNSYLILLGAADGSMTAYDPKHEKFVEQGAKKWCISGEIGELSCANSTVVMGSSTGTIARYPLSNGSLFPEDTNNVNMLKADGPVIALAMDELNVEGLVGTASGCIFYININEKLIIRLVSKACSEQNSISIARFNEANPSLFLTSSAPASATVKLWASSSVDQVMKFSAPPQSAVRFVLPDYINSKFTLIGHANGIMKVISIETLKTEAFFRIQLEQGEELVTAVFNPNHVNFAVGTSNGDVYFGALKEDVNGQAKITVGKLDNISRSTSAGVSCLQFSVFDPIGSFLVAFDNGQIKTWQSSIKNEQFMKLLEYQQQQQQTMNQDINSLQFDLSECGYQQFDLLDTFDMFENPHGLDEITEDDRQQLKLLYANKKHSQCEARFAPGTTQVDLYFSFVSSLQYIYVRNYIQRSIVRRVSIMNFPTCMNLQDYSALPFLEQDDSKAGGEQVLATVGTKEGCIKLYKIDSTGYKTLGHSRQGLSFGAITALDVSSEAQKIVAASQSGEIFTFDLSEHLDQQ